MPFVSIDQLAPGMVLAVDVTDVNGRLLLAQGQPIESKHLTIFKMWGVPEVQIEDADGAQAEGQEVVDPGVLRETAEQLKPAFVHNDLGHPAMAEIFKQAVIHRSQSGSEVAVAVPSPATGAPSSAESGLEMRRRLRRRDIKLPESPAIIYKLNDAIADPFASAEDMAQVIRNSPSLSALLLRIVNSAFYGFPSRIDSVARAITIIGTKEISALAVGITTMELFKDVPKKVFDMQAFVHHSLACGVLARILTAGGNIRNTEQLFVAGLLHDIGRLIVFKYFSKQVPLLLAGANENNTCLYDHEKRLMGFRHTDVAADLFEKWKFPVALSQNVVYHHRPMAAQDPATAAIIHLADLIAHALGEGKSGEWCVPALDPHAWEILRISPKMLATVIPQAMHHLGFLTTVFLEAGR